MPSLSRGMEIFCSHCVERDWWGLVKQCRRPVLRIRTFFSVFQVQWDFKLYEENPSPPTSLDRDAFTLGKLKTEGNCDSRKPLDVTVLGIFSDSYSKPRNTNPAVLRWAVKFLRKVWRLKRMGNVILTRTVWGWGGWEIEAYFISFKGSASSSLLRTCRKRNLPQRQRGSLTVNLHPRCWL